MKNTALFSILFFVSILTVTACTPEDRNLNRPNNFTDQGNLSKGLRVGAYGQTIWASQNVEQAGTLTQLCLNSRKTSVVKSNDKISKSCRLKVNSNSDGATKAAKVSEAWTVDLVLVENGSDYSVVAADGKLERGISTVQFKNINAYIQYQNKSFSMQESADGHFEIEVSATGEIGSDSDSIPFSHQISGEGQKSAATWNFSKLDHQLVLLKRNQTFAVTSENLKLNWINSLCAEPTGQMTATEVGKAAAIIVLSSNEANQVTTTGRKGWNQRFEGCRSRLVPSLNFEFLFF